MLLGTLHVSAAHNGTLRTLHVRLAAWSGKIAVNDKFSTRLKAFLLRTARTVEHLRSRDFKPVAATTRP